MSWLLNHKLVALVVIAAVYYWFVNPPGRFGIARKGLVVYNRIPVAFDCYVDQRGRLHLESDLSEEENVVYWMEHHFTGHQETGAIPLFVGNGFDGDPGITLDLEIMHRCNADRFMISQHPSPEAIARYNLTRAEGKAAAILLKVR